MLFIIALSFGEVSTTRTAIAAILFRV